MRDGSGTGLGCSEQGKVEATLILDDLSFRSGANLLPALVYIISATGEIEFVNQSFTQFTGWTLADLSDGSFVHLIHPDDLEPTMTALQHALAGTGDYTTKLRFLRADGTFRTFYSHALTRRDDAGAVIGLYGVAFDIDESVRAKAEASTMQRRFETFLATVPQLVWTADATGTIDWYNDRWYEYTGQSREEAFGWGWQSVHHPDDFLEVMRRWPDAVATGEPFDMEFRLRGADGYRWFLTRAFPLRDGDGSVIRWFGSNTDIDDQRRAQQRVTRVLQQLAASDVLPEVAGMSVDGIYLPAEAASLVGGDWHDVFALPDGRLAISIGDVAGHGVEAAATAARLRATIAAFAIEDPDPARVLERANRVSLARGEALATCCVAVVDPKAETIEYATAGHPVPIFAATRQPSECGAFGGVPLGASDAVGATTHRRRVPPGTRIVLYTDGLTEFSRSPVDGERRLLRAVDSLVASPREASAQWLRDEVLGDATATDDIAVLVLAIEPGGFVAETAAFGWRFHSSDGATAQRSRHEIAWRLGELSSAGPEALADAELIVGELLANTVEHAPPGSSRSSCCAPAATSCSSSRIRARGSRPSRRPWATVSRRAAAVCFSCGRSRARSRSAEARPAAPSCAWCSRSSGPGCPWRPPPRRRSRRTRSFRALRTCLAGRLRLVLGEDDVDTLARVGEDRAQGLERRVVGVAGPHDGRAQLHRGLLEAMPRIGFGLVVVEFGLALPLGDERAAVIRDGVDAFAVERLRGDESAVLEELQRRVDRARARPDALALLDATDELVAVLRAVPEQREEDEFHVAASAPTARTAAAARAAAPECLGAEGAAHAIVMMVMGSPMEKLL